MANSNYGTNAEENKFNLMKEREAGKSHKTKALEKMKGKNGDRKLSFTPKNERERRSFKKS